MWKGSVKSIHITTAVGEEMTSVDQVQAVAGKGLEGDRYFASDKPDSQVTLIESEAIDAMAKESGVELEYGDARRNIVTQGVPLNHLVGREFQVGPVTLRGIRLNEPCNHLAEMTDRKVLRSLVHRGGLKAEILNDGAIRPGDTVSG
ncbi:MAG: MOSC domain-containing protein [Chloroflexi bacterium]|nr:MOSC domain-containing protein [Chloroflexota bacterium]